MNNDFDPYQMVHYVIDLVEKHDNSIQCCEAYLGKDMYLNIDVEENAIKYSREGLERGISVRVFDRKGRCGFSFTNRMDKNNLEEIVQKALQLMKGATPDAEFHDLPPQVESYPKIKQLCDAKIKAMKIDDASHHIIDAIEVCKNDETAISQSAYFKSNYSQIFILNSNGVEVNYKETSCSISSNMIAKDKTTNETSFGQEWQVERNLNDLNAQEVAQNALEIAKNNLNRKKIKNMNVPLVLTPRGAISLILRPISLAIDAENFQFNRSFLIGHKGKKIGSKLLTIEDNGLIDGAIGSSISDDEGTPCQNKTIIKEGMFLENGLIHNSYTAAKEGVKSTGNAVRTSYASSPGIGVTNFSLKLGSSAKEEIIRDIKKGILLDYTGDSPNISTGDFSGLILQGNLIEDGKILYALNETMLANHLLELFSNITAISEESKTYGRFTAPFVKIENANIIGSAPKK
ncbi:MAG: Peptidase PmbA [Promethearchaeota archaeon]|nr:MAG: Peptidase PmbA [Candidatus Lokiarchaeota archaeon]